MDQVTCMGLDEEWIDLIITARNRGMGVEDIRAFLRSGSYTMEALLAAADEGNKEIC